MSEELPRLTPEMRDKISEALVAAFMKDWDEKFEILKKVRKVTLARGFVTNGFFFTVEDGYPGPACEMLKVVSINHNSGWYCYAQPDQVEEAKTVLIEKAGKDLEEDLKLFEEFEKQYLIERLGKDKNSNALENDH